MFQSSCVRAEPIEGKGNGFRCIGEAVEGSGIGAAQGTLLLRETAFESWTEGQFSAATVAARLFFRARQSESNALLLAKLFPSNLEMIPLPRRQQIPQSTVNTAIELVVGWESEHNEKETSPTQRPKPTSNELLRFFFVVECNSFPTGILVTLSNANHSCDPNCLVLQEELDSCNSHLPVYTLTAKRDIAVGEEISISYIDTINMVELAEDRQRRLEEHFLFKCACDLCCFPLKPVGLLTSIAESDLFGPRFEDYACHAFPLSATIAVAPVSGDSGDLNNETQKLPHCNGLVGKRTGLCEQCGRQATLKQLENVEGKVDRLISSLRRLLLETNEFLRKLDENQAKQQQQQLLASSSSSSSSSLSSLTSLSSSLQSLSLSRPSSSESHATTTTEGDERIKDAATIKELGRLKKLVEGLKTRANELLHSSHLAFGPINVCLEKLDNNLAGSNATKGTGKPRKGKSNAKPQKVD